MDKRYEVFCLADRYFYETPDRLSSSRTDDSTGRRQRRRRRQQRPGAALRGRAAHRPRGLDGPTRRRLAALQPRRHTGAQSAAAAGLEDPRLGRPGQRRGDPAARSWTTASRAAYPSIPARSPAALLAAHRRSTRRAAPAANSSRSTRPTRPNCERSSPSSARSSKESRAPTSSAICAGARVRSTSATAASPSGHCLDDRRHGGAGDGGRRRDARARPRDPVFRCRRGSRCPSSSRRTWRRATP